MPACQCPLIYGYTVSVSTTGSNTLRKYTVVEPLEQCMWNKYFLWPYTKVRNKFCVATHTLKYITFYMNKWCKLDFYELTIESKISEKCNYLNLQKLIKWEHIPQSDTVNQTITKENYIHWHPHANAHAEVNGCRHAAQTHHTWVKTSQ